MGQQTIEDLFFDYYYLDSINLSHTHSLEDKIIDKDFLLLARTKDSGVMIYYLYSSDQIWVPIEYINIFLSFMREEGDRLVTIKPKSNISVFILSMCHLVKSLFYGLTLDREIITKMINIGSKEFREFMLEKFDVKLPGITIENIKDKITC